jgi:hypothetical protein
MSRLQKVLSAILFLVSIPAANSQVCQADSVIVTALDAHGAPIPNLTAASFRAVYKGQPLNILSASFRQDPTVRIVVLLDTSMSMAGVGAQGFEKWRIAHLAASEFIAATPPGARISLFTLSGKSSHAFQSAGGKQPIEDWLNSKEMLGTSSLKGRTALYRALWQTLKGLEPTQPGDAIYVVTDGHDFVNGGSVSRVAAELQSSGVRLYTFLLNDLVGSDVHTSMEGVVTSAARPRLGPGELTDLVQGSGGLGFTWYPGDRSKTNLYQMTTTSFEYDANTLPAIRARTHAIERAIDNFYILGVSPPQRSAVAEAWKLEVVDADGKKRKDVTLAYPGKLMDCSVALAQN